MPLFTSRSGGLPLPLAAGIAAALLAVAPATVATPASDVRPFAGGPSAPLATLHAKGFVPQPAGFLTPVENCNDSGPGSLRQTLLDVTDSAVLDLRELPCSKITLTTGALSTTANGAVTLYGPISFIHGRPSPGVTIDAAGASRVIVSAAVRLDLRGVALQNGHTTDARGGCVAATGSVALIASSVSGCTAIATGSDSALGGGVWTAGSAVAVMSAIAGNSARAAPGGYAYGGGIFAVQGLMLNFSIVFANEATGYSYGGGAAATGSFVVVNSAVVSNRAAHEAGLGIFGGPAVEPGDLRIINSTIASNQATGAAGGVGCSGDLLVGNSTIASNSGSLPGRAAGIAFSGSRVLTLDSSIVSGNDDLDISGASTIVGAHNLVGVSTTSLPPDTIDADPLLGSPGDHGGIIPVMALGTGSAAIDAGSNVHALGCDGRGVDLLAVGENGHVYPRIVGGGADIGAYEAGAEDVLFGDGFERFVECGG